MGGITGTIYFYHLHIDFLWVNESIHHDGYGGKLLYKIEEIAKEKGCRLILFDSFSFQAPAFYKKHGYREFGVVEEHPKGIVSTFLRNDYKLNVISLCKLCREVRENKSSL